MLRQIGTNDYLLELIITHQKSITHKTQLTLKECCSFISRGITPIYETSDTLVLGQTCIRNHQVVLENARQTRFKEFANKSLRQWDILVNSTGVGSLGRVAQVWFEPVNLTADSHITIVRPVDKFKLYLAVELMLREDEIINMAQGSTGQTELSRNDLSAMLINNPDDAELQHFNATVGPMMLTVQCNLKQNNMLKRVRNELLKHIL